MALHGLCFNHRWEIRSNEVKWRNNNDANRRQFLTQAGEDKKKERKLLDYQAHATKLVGALAQSLTFNFAQNHMNDYYVAFVAELYAGSENYKPLKIIHHFASGLKAFYTNSVSSTLTVLREACGGTGFHQYSGLPYLSTEHSAYIHFEGDNTVMIQQCAKLILDGV